MERIAHELVQGSSEWHQFRLDHDGASEAAAALGISKKVTRAELLRAKHTGVAKEFSDFVQTHILDHGHAVEALARPIAEKILGEELFPVTYSYGRPSASCDGLTMSGAVVWEHKQPNEELAAAVKRGELPEEHQPQVQQEIYVTGAERALFMVSDGTEENCVHMFVEPDPTWQKRILDGWALFNEDLANYQHVEPKVDPVAAPILELPALVVQVEGRVVSSNLIAFRAAASSFIAKINTSLATDQDFVDAERTIKFCKDGEDRLEVVKAQALAQTASIDELFRTVDMISAELRTKRLELNKLVEARKQSIRVEIVQEGRDAFAAHVEALQKRLGKNYLPAIPADFPGVIKGKKTIASLRAAVDAELTRAKLAANAAADAIQINLNAFRTAAKGCEFLFPDLGTLVLKGADDFSAAVRLRISEHREQQKKRDEEERERIRAEESRKAQEEAERKVADERREEELRRQREDQERLANERDTREAEEQAKADADRKAREAQAAAEVEEWERQQATERQKRAALNFRNLLIATKAECVKRPDTKAIIKAIDAYLAKQPETAEAAP